MAGVDPGGGVGSVFHQLLRPQQHLLRSTNPLVHMEHHHNEVSPGKTPVGGVEAAITGGNERGGHGGDYPSSSAMVQIDDAGGCGGERGSGSAAPTRWKRGRPAGSKNKPKAPIVVTRDSPSALHSRVLEVAAGADVVGCVADYARRMGCGVCVLSGGGAVASVALKQPRGMVAASSGPFEILSLTGTVLPPPAPLEANRLTLFLNGRHGQLIGGSVVGTLVAAGPVVLMAVSFTNAVYERLPLYDGGEKTTAAATESEPVFQAAHPAGPPRQPADVGPCHLPTYNFGVWSGCGTSLVRPPF